MRKMKKVTTSLLLAAVMTVVSVVPVSAAASDNWSINYIPNATSAVSKQVHICKFTYYGDGFIGKCKSISGQNGRRLTISSSSAGGMKTVPVTTKGATKAWQMKKAVKGAVSFLVAADSGYSCTSTGVIKINK